ncbi:MAG: NAD(P)H-dependent oxidoreductase [Bacteroidota bacterium]
MITIISGTNRKNARSYKLTLQYQDLLNKLGAETSIIDLQKLPADFIQSALYDNSGKNEAFNPTRELVKKSEKFVFIIPEYNGSFPGILKTFIDALEFPNSFKGKKAALVGLSSGVQGSTLAMSHLTDILNYLGMHVLALKPKLMQIENRMEDGEVVDDLGQKLLQEQAEALIKF